MERLLKYFTPEHYRILLMIDIATETMRGSVTVEGVAHDEVVRLHAEGMEIDAVKVNGQADAEFWHEDGILNIKLPKFQNRLKSTKNSSKKLKEGSRTAISVKYHLKINHNMEGVYVSTFQYEGETHKMIATQFESHYARQCFPCVDEPEAKAAFSLRIAADRNYSVLSNLPEIDGQEVMMIDRRAAEEGDIVELPGFLHIFKETPPMSTYLLAFVVGELTGVTGYTKDQVLVATYAPKCYGREMLEFANETAVRALDFYTEKFGISYPLPKLSQVAIPDFEAGAMENWGLVTYRDVALLVAPNAPVSARKYVSTTVTHELAHQWFGNLVTMKWWNDLWLNESFANIMEYICSDALYPEFNIWNEFFTGDVQAAFKRDALTGVQAVQQDVENPEEISTLFDGAIVYAKGAHLMLMLMRTIGEEKFFAGLHDYFKKFAFENTCGDDLWEALQPYADFDVREFMHKWISQPGYPVLEHGKDGEFSQKRFLLDGSSDETRWPLPSVTDDLSGHYIIKLTDAEFAEKLAKWKDLSLEQKLRLLSDRILLVQAQIAPASSLVELLKNLELQNDTSEAVWEMIARATGVIGFFFDPETPEEKSWHKFLTMVIQAQLERLGIEPDLDDSQNDIDLRATILGLAFAARDLPTLEGLAALGYDNNDFKLSDLEEIDPEIRDDVIAAELYINDKAGKSDYLDFLLKSYTETVDPELKQELLSSACLAKNSQNTEKLLKLLDNSEVVKPQDHFYLYLYLIRNYKTKAKTFKWLTQHWDWVRENAGDKSLEYYPRFTAANVRSEAESREFHKFFDQFNDSPLLARVLKMADVEIETNLKRLAAQKDAVRRAL